MPPPPPKSAATREPERHSARYLVWDLPLRLFHWGLVASVCVSLYTMKTQGAPFAFPQTIHAQAGLVGLGLLLFRWGWLICGSRHSRARDWLAGPRVMGHYVGALLRRRPPPHAAHNPLGGWAVMAMLISLTLQALTGLFLSDDVFFDAPLHTTVSSAVSDVLLGIHHVNGQVVIVLIVLHLTALVVHRLLGEHLVGAMVTGKKAVEPHEDEALTGVAGAEESADWWWKALLLASASAGIVVWLWSRL
ncbi:cytochrome b/b6 domain-containing protein [Halomonas sp. V046]|uniref:cytochrome b/b6 domain-containing protein n=1 Tax=Halomonas sp. V046 TaxID=3459611 RepID=UPI004043CB27